MRTVSMELWSSLGLLNVPHRFVQNIISMKFVPISIYHESWAIKLKELTKRKLNTFQILSGEPGPRSKVVLSTK